MHRYVFVLVWLSSALLGVQALGDVTLATKDNRAWFSGGTLTALADGKDNVFVTPGPETPCVAVHTLKGVHHAVPTAAAGDGKEPALEVPGLRNAHVDMHYQTGESGDITVCPEVTMEESGLCGVEWTLAYVPLKMNILVPGYSGLKLTADSPESKMVFDYPTAWEAQMVVVEGAGKGFGVWAADTRGCFKRLTVDRTDYGWRLSFMTMPFAPFEKQNRIEPITWHIGTYEGDWRVAARRYRDWAVQAFKPTPTKEQKPVWVKDIRCSIIMPLDMATLEALGEKLDPRQTLLYVYDWRKDGYDRNYPEYDNAVDGLRPFIERAHALGFRVMLHVNYFGCDPLNPVYAQFEPYQIRDAYGTHEKGWWLWNRAEPPIKFAYINPAHKPWRDLLVLRLSALCHKYEVDALHLDQTLCISNDHNGLIDGMSMLDGAVALHKDLREALPEVALSGEGLDEVTYRHEAFAQRHVPYGIDHANGWFSAPKLAMAHPIGSYLLGDYTKMYGYLGMAPASSGQMYAAWREAYRHWGVIPSLHTDALDLKTPSPFTRQFLDEMGFWFGQRVEPDMDGDWPENVVFQYKTQSGTPVVWTTDRRLVADGKEISRTLFGVRSVTLPGSIPSIRTYTDAEIKGLDPTRWYPYFATPRDLGALHAEELSEDTVMDAVIVKGQIGAVRFACASDSTIDLSLQVAHAHCGSRPTKGEAYERVGELDGADGAMLKGATGVLQAQPPYKGTEGGVVYIRFDLDLPLDATRFVCDVMMDPGAIGPDRTDGCVFRVEAKSDKMTNAVEAYQATDTPSPLVLDLKSFAGRHCAIEIAIGAGPKNDPTYDWARVGNPRVERSPRREARVRLAGIPTRFTYALAGTHRVDLDGSGRADLLVPVPGAAYLLSAKPAVADVPCRLDKMPFDTSFVLNDGTVAEAPPYATASAGECSAGGVTKAGLFCHPPDGGQTQVAYAFTVPSGKTSIHAFAGLRDGAKSDGVSFSILVNGEPRWHWKGNSAGWQEASVDLARWVNEPVVVTLVTDAEGSNSCDWAWWGEPMIAVP